MGHTPGPWRASEGWPSDIWHVDMPGRKWSVPVARHDEDDDMPVEEVQANARLIAAAPELLDRLKSMVSGAECECDTADEDHPMCDICWSRQVIAKAEGRSE